MVLVACASKADRWSDFNLPDGTADASTHAGNVTQGGSSATRSVDDDPYVTVDTEAAQVLLTVGAGTSGTPAGENGPADVSDVLASGADRSTDAAHGGAAGLDTRAAGGMAGTRDNEARAAGGEGDGQGGTADVAWTSRGPQADAGAGGMPAGGAAGSVLVAGTEDAGGSALVAGAGAGGNGGRDAPVESEGARAGGIGMAGNAGAAGAGAPPAPRATPVKAVLRYRDEDGTVLDEVTTTRFRFLGTCRPEDAVTLCYDALGLNLARHNEMELWLDLGDEWPANETCWYYDHDGDPVNWRMVDDPLGCDWYLTNWGTKGTRFKETEDLDPYWTVHYHPETGQSSAFMAWGYADGEQYKYIWFFSASDDI